MPTKSLTVRILAGSLAMLVLLPGYRLLDPATTGLAGSAFLRSGPGYGIMMVTGTAGALVVGSLAYLALGGRRVLRGFASAGRILTLPSPITFAALVGGLAFLLTAAFSLLGLNGAPATLDSASQLLHARYVAEGALAGPDLPAVEFWDFQYMLETPAGWVSQYPPGHILLLGLGVWLGAPWLIGPLVLGCTVCVTSLLGEEIFGEGPVARLGALLAATSPFLIGATVALYAALRALRGRWRWTILVGTAVGLTVLTRPLFGLLMAVIVSLGALWVAAPRERSRDLGKRVLGVLVGGLPWAVFLFWYNARFFGSPFRFGYTAAQGDAHGLGFHPDPWGARYGPTEALAYTMGELRALSVDFLQTPLPALFVVIAYGLLVAEIPRRAWLLVAWAGGLVAVNFFYWHHDLLLGPRMLNESAPAWALLTAFTGAGLVRWGGGRGEEGADEGDATRSARDRERSMAWLASTLGVSLLIGWLALAPMKLREYGQNAWAEGWTREYPGSITPSLVFVHGSWSGRLGARLTALGLSSDSVRVALATNPPCAVQNALDTGRARRDLVYRHGETADPGAGGGSLLNPECIRQQAADRETVVGLPQVIWRGDLPGLEPRGAMYVRDMGPRLNRRVLDRYANRTPLMLGLDRREAGFVLRPYDDAVWTLWGPAMVPGGE